MSTLVVIAIVAVVVVFFVFGFALCRVSALPDETTDEDES